MRNPTLYRWARLIHRYLVVIIVMLGIVMMASGYMMHEGVYFGMDPMLVRYVHNSVSTVFSIVLGMMMITGSYLFLFPYLR